MNKLTKYILLVLVAAAGVSCRKYVEVNQPNQRVLKYTNDFQLLLNDISTMETSYSLPLLSEDDVDITGVAAFDARMVNEVANIYTWSGDYYRDDQTDIGWNQLYKVIYVCNEIIAYVKDSEGGTQAKKDKIYAEALVQRAYSYMLLANMYAPVYDAATAATGMGLPLKTNPDLFTDLTRSSLQDTYNLIIGDINTALPFLPTIASNNLHPNKAAAFATLARTYLYMSDYSKAGDYAAQALALNDSILDLRKYTFATLSQIPKRILRAEVLLSKSAFKFGGASYPLSAELLSKFDNTDLRYTLYTSPGNTNGVFPSFTPGRASYKYNIPSSDNISTGPTVPEMMLIRAESLARNNQLSAAMDLVNKLRTYRFMPADYKALSATTVEEAMRHVLAERRRELFDNGLRWFDQRRLSKDPVYGETETRVLKGTTYTLAPGSNRYIYPIAPNIIRLNPEIKQNDR